MSAFDGLVPRHAATNTLPASRFHFGAGGAPGGGAQGGGAPGVASPFAACPNPGASLADAAADGLAPVADLAVDARAAAEAPQSLCGRFVRRLFGPLSWFDGCITSTRRLDGGTGARVWCVTYTDGDEQELEWHELRDWLLSRTQSHFASLFDDGPVSLASLAAGTGSASHLTAALPTGAAARAAMGTPPSSPLPLSPRIASMAAPAPDVPLNGASAEQAARSSALFKRMPAARQRGDDAAREVCTRQSGGFPLSSGDDDVAPQPDSAGPSATALPVVLEEPRYKGVTRSHKPGEWRLWIQAGGSVHSSNGFLRAEDAARAYDKLARKHGIKAVNFPVAGLGEVQAVFGEPTIVMLRLSKPSPATDDEQHFRVSTADAVEQAGERRACFTRSSGAVGAGPLCASSSPQYHGVRRGSPRVAGPPRFWAHLKIGKTHKYFGAYDTAEAAARAHDAAARSAGKAYLVNFPKTDTERAAAAESCRRGRIPSSFRSATLPSGGPPSPMDCTAPQPARASPRPSSRKRSCKQDDAACGPAACEASKRRKASASAPAAAAVTLHAAPAEPSARATRTALVRSTPPQPTRASLRVASSRHVPNAAAGGASAVGGAARKCRKAAAPAAAAAAPSAAAAAPSPCAAAAVPHASTRLLPQRQRYKGVFPGPVPGQWRMCLWINGRCHKFHLFSCAEDAARAYDDLARKHCIKVVNFPVAELGEVKAVHGEDHRVTLAHSTPAPLPPARASLRAASSKRVRHDAEGASPAGGSALKRHKTASPAAAATAAAAPLAAAAASSPRAAAAAPPVGASPSNAQPTTNADAVRSFLRTIEPPLSNLDEALAAVADTNLSMRVLALPARMRSELRHDVMERIAQQLRVRTETDKLALIAALDRL